jgi:hypothetical protein
VGRVDAFLCGAIVYGAIVYGAIFFVVLVVHVTINEFQHSLLDRCRCGYFGIGHSFDHVVV